MRHFTDGAKLGQRGLQFGSSNVDYCRAAVAAIPFGPGPNGLSCAGALAAGGGATAGCGGAGTGSGQIGSIAGEPDAADWVTVWGGGFVGCCLCARREEFAACCAVGLAAAAAATPGNAGPVGSALMMLTAGIDDDEGKSMFTPLRRGA
jgi:hypothetical protein